MTFVCQGKFNICTMLGYDYISLFSLRNGKLLFNFIIIL